VFQERRRRASISGETWRFREVELSKRGKFETERLAPQAARDSEPQRARGGASVCASARNDTAPAFRTASYSSPRVLIVPAPAIFTARWVSSVASFWPFRFAGRLHWSLSSGCKMRRCLAPNASLPISSNNPISCCKAGGKSRNWANETDTEGWRFSGPLVAP